MDGGHVSGLVGSEESSRVVNGLDGSGTRS